MASWVTSGDALAGLYNISSPRYERWYLVTYRGDGYTQNGYKLAHTYKTSDLNANWAKFRIKWVKNGKANSNAASISWYNIVAVHGWESSYLSGTADTLHNLNTCYSYSTYKNENMGDHCGTTFGYRSAGTNDAALWGFWKRDNGDYNIVSYASWKGVGTASSGGNVHWLISGATSGNYELAELAKWSVENTNPYWPETFLAWTLHAREDQYVRVGGKWKKITQPYIKVGGSWKPVMAVYVKVGGHWKLK